MNMYTYYIKRDLFRCWLYGEAKAIHNESSGNIITLLRSYSTECLYFVIRNIIHFSNGILKLVILTVLLFLINWRIGLFIIIASPFSVYINVVFGRKNKEYGKFQREHYSSYIGWLYEIIRSFSDIRILGAQNKSKKEFHHRNKTIFEVNKKSAVAILTSNNIISFINLLVRLTIYAFAGYMATRNNITIGTLLIIISYYDILTEQIWWTSNAYIDSQRRVPYIKSICDYLNTPKEISRQGSQVLRITNGDIIFNSVNFSYHNSTTLFQKLSLRIRGGKKTAIVGGSGSGKSTLAYLLLAIYQPSDGKIMVDGNDLSLCSLKSIRSNVGLVSQDILLFATTIRENILMGNQEATEDDLIEACKKAELWEYIESLPKKLDTFIGENGQDLSGGEKQRIAIARIYIRNPSIIIFDEATSSLDKKTEQAIHAAWKNILQNKTSIVIAHKLSSVYLCDDVVVMKDGRICATGSLPCVAKYNDEFNRIFFNHGVKNGDQEF